MEIGVISDTHGLLRPEVCGHSTPARISTATSSVAITLLVIAATMRRIVHWISVCLCMALVVACGKDGTTGPYVPFQVTHVIPLDGVSPGRVAVDPEIHQAYVVN